MSSSRYNLYTSVSQNLLPHLATEQPSCPVSPLQLCLRYPRKSSYVKDFIIPPFLEKKAEFGNSDMPF